MKFSEATAFIKDDKLIMSIRFGEIHGNIGISFKATGYQTLAINTSRDAPNKTILIDPVPTRI